MVSTVVRLVAGFCFICRRNVDQRTGGGIMEMEWVRALLVRVNNDREVAY